MARSAFTQGLHLTAITGTVVMIGLTVLVLLVLRHVDAGAASEDEPEFAPDEAVVCRVIAD